MTAGENSSGIILTDLRVSQEAVHKKLKSLNPNKSPGPDQLFPKLLVELSAELSLPFTILFNSSLEHGVIPKDWKHAIVTPIFKKGSKTSTNNYRPVSLTSIVCKLLESFVRDSIQTHMEELKLYSDCQHGFRSGRSCIQRCPFPRFNRDLPDFLPKKCTSPIFSRFHRLLLSFTVFIDRSH